MFILYLARRLKHIFMKDLRNGGSWTSLGILVFIFSPKYLAWMVLLVNFKNVGLFWVLDSILEMHGEVKGLFFFQTKPADVSHIEKMVWWLAKEVSVPPLSEKLFPPKHTAVEKVLDRAIYDLWYWWIEDSRNTAGLPHPDRYVDCYGEKGLFIFMDLERLYKVETSALNFSYGSQLKL